MDEFFYRKLVKRYLDKKSTDEELEVFVHLMKQGKLDKYIQEAMDAELGLHEQADDTGQSSRRDYITALFSKLSVAAILLLVSGLVIWIIAINRHNLNPSLMAGALRQHLTTGVVDTVRVSNTTGYINKIVLPDQSIVWLEPNAKVSYPAKFTGKFRSVSMSGEAFFEVTKDHAHPFTINAGKVLTKVWGTSFSIKAIAGHETKVSVLTGKVSVTALANNAGKSTQHSEIMLTPNEEAIYHPAAGKLRKAIVPLSSDLGIWKKSDLSFENAPLSHVVKVLNDSYNVHISVQDMQINSYQITADFSGENLADILLLICKSVHISYTKTGNYILLSRIN